MRPPEDTYFLEKILARRTKPLRFVLVECNPIRLRLTSQIRDTMRAVYWHDNARMRVIFQTAFFTDRKKRTWNRRLQKIAEVWPDFSEHLGYWVSRNSNLGRGHELLAEWFGVVPAKGLPASGIARRMDGFQPYPEMGSMDAEETANYVAQIADYSGKLAAMRANSKQGSVDEKFSLEELQVKRRLIEQAGGRMVLVIPPYIGGAFFSPKPEHGQLPVLDFSSPEKYPELFSVEHRADAGHTNSLGSQIYTRLVARDLLELLKKESH